MTIPPPQEKQLQHLLSRNTPHEELREAIGWTEAQFQSFKVVVRQSAQDLQLGVKFYDTQSESKRTALVQKAAKKFPDLTRFEDSWPLRLYFDRWVKERLRKRGAEPTSNVKKRKIESGGEKEGRPPKRRVTSQKSGERKIIRVGQAFAATADGTESSGSDEDVPLARRKPCQPVLASLANLSWPTWCPWCGSAPPIPHNLTGELRHLFPDLLDEFRAVGIVHDLHLRIVASKLGSKSRAFILRTFSPKLSAPRASQTAKTIADKIDAYYGTHKNVPIPEGDILVCTRHEAKYRIEVPPALCLKLQQLGMEEIGPAVFALGVETDTNFKTVCAMPDGQKDMWSTGKEVRFSALQCEILKLTFA
ncbi:hypothetical protein FB45DRAFT_1026985 [Roridomyces roridus]|uniref:Uncharacterized protein n=1 Tax=Roridomyces roridus TaxID=1738132 RepID=A0AAD7BX91_9AGAR|nr:hypothetical protein FB45DRAFT_1026985 [Roridomyces roridus]